MQLLSCTYLAIASNLASEIQCHSKAKFSLTLGQFKPFANGFLHNCDNVFVSMLQLLAIV